MSFVAVGGITVIAALAGFVWLPSVQKEFPTQSIWQSICRAAGVATPSTEYASTSLPVERTTAVVLSRSMARRGSAEAIGLGATIALRCTICHGAQGVSDSDAPDLAGQYPEVVGKQLTDYRNGDRSNTVMQAYAEGLTTAQVQEVAAYYADLEHASRTSVAESAAPLLVRVGDPMRNIAPCASCHGGSDHKLGAPWLTGMPKNYLVLQLDAFASGRRRNDSHGQMRNMARRLSSEEIDRLASWYARP